MLIPSFGFNFLQRKQIPSVDQIATVDIRKSRIIQNIKSLVSQEKNKFGIILILMPSFSEFP